MQEANSECWQSSFSVFSHWQGEALEGGQQTVRRFTHGRGRHGEMFLMDKAHRLSRMAHAYSAVERGTSGLMKLLWLGDYTKSRARSPRPL